MDVLTLCNACDCEPMAEGQDRPFQPGYCDDCLADLTCDHCGEKVPLPGMEYCGEAVEDNEAGTYCATDGPPCPVCSEAEINCECDG